MEDKSKKKAIVSLVSGIVVFLILLIGAAYAYFRVLAINNFGSENMTARAGNLGSVVLSGSHATLSMELTPSDMRKNNSDIIYYAGTNGKTTTPTTANFGTVMANTGNDSITNDSYATYHCEYQIEVTHSVNDDQCDFEHDLYYVFNSIIGSKTCYGNDGGGGTRGRSISKNNYHQQYKATPLEAYSEGYYDSNTGYVFIRPDEYDQYGIGYKNASEGQIILSVNGIDYDFFGPWPDIIRGEFDVNPSTPKAFTAGLRYVNSTEIDQTYISGASIDIDIEVTKLECVPVDNLHDYYWAYEWNGNMTYSDAVSDPVTDYHDLDHVYLLVGEVEEDDGQTYGFNNDASINLINKSSNPNQYFKRLDNESPIIKTVRLYKTSSECQNALTNSDVWDDAYYNFSVIPETLRCVERSMDVFVNQYFETSIASDTNNIWNAYRREVGRYYYNQTGCEQICSEYGCSCVEDDFSSIYYLIYNVYARNVEPWNYEGCQENISYASFSPGGFYDYDERNTTCEEVFYYPTLTNNTNNQYNSYLDCIEGVDYDIIDSYHTKSICYYNSNVQKWILSYFASSLPYGFTYSECQEIIENAMAAIVGYNLVCTQYVPSLVNIANSSLPTFSDPDDCYDYLDEYLDRDNYTCGYYEDSEFVINYNPSSIILNSSRTFDSESDCESYFSGPLGTPLGYSCFYDSSLTKWKYRVDLSSMPIDKTIDVASFNQLLTESNTTLPSGWNVRNNLMNYKYLPVRPYTSYYFNSLSSCEDALNDGPDTGNYSGMPKCVKGYAMEDKLDGDFKTKSDCDTSISTVNSGYHVCKPKYQNGETIYENFANDALPPKICANLKDGNTDHEICLPYDAWNYRVTYKSQLESLGMTCEYKYYGESSSGLAPEANYFKERYNFKLLDYDDDDDELEMFTYDTRPKYLYCKNDKLYFIIMEEKVSASIYEGVNPWDYEEEDTNIPVDNGNEYSEKYNVSLLSNENKDYEVKLLSAYTPNIQSSAAPQISCATEIVPKYIESYGGNSGWSEKSREVGVDENNVILLKEYTIPSTENINVICYYGMSVPYLLTGPIPSSVDPGGGEVIK